MFVLSELLAFDVDSIPLIFCSEFSTENKCNLYIAFGDIELQSLLLLDELFLM